MNMFKVNNKDTRAISLTPSGNCIVNFEQISQLVLCSVSQKKKQLTLNIDMRELIYGCSNGAKLIFIFTEKYSNVKRNF